MGIVRTEVLAGMRPREEKATHPLLNQVQWLEVDVELTDAAGDLAGRIDIQLAIGYSQAGSANQRVGLWTVALSILYSSYEYSAPSGS